MNPFQVSPVDIVGETSVVATPATAVTFVLYFDVKKVILLGTSLGEVICYEQITSEEWKVNSTKKLVLKQGKPITKLVYLKNQACVLAICGGDLFLFNFNFQLLNNNNKKILQLNGEGGGKSLVLDACLNQRGPPDWGLVVITSSPVSSSSSSSMVVHLHLFTLPEQRSNNSNSNSEYVRYKEITLDLSPIGNFRSIVYYDTCFAISGNRGCGIVNEITQQFKLIPVAVDPLLGAIIVPLTEGRLLITCLESVGVVVDLSGNPLTSGNSTLVWSKTPISIITCGPYVACLLENLVLEIRASTNLGDVLQSFPMSPGTFMVSITMDGEEFLIGEKIMQQQESSNLLRTISEDQRKRQQAEALRIVLGNKSVKNPFFLLNAISLDERIESLLGAGEMDKALLLLQMSLPQTLTREEIQWKESLFYFKAARVSMKKKDFAQAFLSYRIIEADPIDSFFCFGNEFDLLFEWFQVDKGSNRDEDEVVDFGVGAFRSELLSYCMEYLSKKQQTKINNEHGGAKKLELLKCCMLQLLLIITPGVVVVDNNQQETLSQTMVESIIKAIDWSKTPKPVIDYVLDLLLREGGRKFELMRGIFILQNISELLKPHAMEALAIFKKFQKPKEACELIASCVKEEENEMSGLDLYAKNVEWLLPLVEKEKCEEFFLTHCLMVLFKRYKEQFLEIVFKKSEEKNRFEMIYCTFINETFEELVPLVGFSFVLGYYLETVLWNNSNSNSNNDRHRRIETYVYDAMERKGGLLSTQETEAFLTKLEEYEKNDKSLQRLRVPFLKRLRKHWEALEILLQIDFPQAEAYCTSVNEEEEKIKKSNNVVDSFSEAGGGGRMVPNSENAFQCLALLLLDEDNFPERSEEKKQCLLRQWKYLNPSQIIQNISDERALKSEMLNWFLLESMGDAQKQRRQSRVNKNLEKLNNLNERQKLLDLQNKFVVISSNSLCSQCGAHFSLSDYQDGIMLETNHVGLLHSKCLLHPREDELFNRDGRGGKKSLINSLNQPSIPTTQPSQHVELQEKEDDTEWKQL